MPSPSHSSRSILILSTHLRLGLPSVLLPSGFPIKTLHTPSPHPYAPHAQPISFFLIHPNIIHPSTPRSPQWPPSLRFPHQDPTHPLSSPIRSTCPAHQHSSRSILILSTHLRLGLPSGLLPSGFPIKTLHTPSPHPYAPHAQPIVHLVCFIKRTTGIKAAGFWGRKLYHVHAPMSFKTKLNRLSRRA